MICEYWYKYRHCSNLSVSEPLSPVTPHRFVLQIIYQLKIINSCDWSCWYWLGFDYTVVIVLTPNLFYIFNICNISMLEINTSTVATSHTGSTTRECILAGLYLSYRSMRTFKGWVIVLAFRNNWQSTTTRVISNGTINTCIMIKTYWWKLQVKKMSLTLSLTGVKVVYPQQDWADH